MAALLSEQFEYMLSQLRHGLLKDLTLLATLAQGKELQRHLKHVTSVPASAFLLNCMGARTRVRN